MKALLLENIHPAASRILAEHGFEVETVAGALEEAELIEALPGVDLLGIRSRTKVTDAVIQSAPEQLRAIGAFCIGTNQVRLSAAALRGIPVFNAPYSNTRSVVELIVGEIIDLARRVTVANSKMHKGIWAKSASGAHEVRGRTLGIVGYGNIGSQLSVVAESLGLRVIYFDIVDKLALGNAQPAESLEALLEAADVVSLHVDGRPGNAGLFGEEQFARMRPGSLFLNASRGFVVDYRSLAAHLTSKHLAGAAIDVFEPEPQTNTDPFDSPLQGFDNVILTPHIGGSTQEAQVDIGNFVATKLVDYVEFGATSMSVNVPQVLPTPNRVGHRILDLHRNVPGALAHLNHVLASHNANVEAQTLATAGQLGYVVTDVTGVTNGLLHDLNSLEETVRAQVILPPVG